MNLLTTPVMYGLAGVALAAGVFAGVQTLRLAHEKQAHAETKAQNAQVLQGLAEATAKTVTAVRKREAEVGALLADANDAREKDIAHAVENEKRVVTDLRAGNLRLRQQWASCAATARVSGDAAASVIADGQTELWAESAGRIVRAGDDADIQVAGLQAYASACHALTAKAAE